MKGGRGARFAAPAIAVGIEPAHGHPDQRRESHEHDELCHGAPFRPTLLAIHSQKGDDQRCEDDQPEQIPRACQRISQELEHLPTCLPCLPAFPDIVHDTQRNCRMWGLFGTEGRFREEPALPLAHLCERRLHAAGQIAGPSAACFSRSFAGAQSRNPRLKIVCGSAP